MERHACIFDLIVEQVLVMPDSPTQELIEAVRNTRSGEPYSHVVRYDNRPPLEQPRIGDTYDHGTDEFTRVPDPPPPDPWVVENVTPNQELNAIDTTTDEVANTFGTLIEQLKNTGIIS